GQGEGHRGEDSGAGQAHAALVAAAVLLEAASARQEGGPAVELAPLPEAPLVVHPRGILLRLVRVVHGRRPPFRKRLPRAALAWTRLPRGHYTDRRAARLVSAVTFMMFKPPRPPRTPLAPLLP